MGERLLSRCFFAFCLLPMLVSGAVPAAAPMAADEGWPLLAGYLFRDAREAFARDPAGSERVRRLGLAASLLNDPPVTPGKVAEAETLLRRLMETGPADETALYARYLLARVIHMHRTAEIAEIEAAYRGFMTGAPDHPLAQLAAGKLALVLLYERPDLTVPQRIAGAAALEPAAAARQLPETASSFYRVLANAALFYGVCDERVLGWLRRADEIGPQDIVAATGLRIQIAEIARALGRREEALGFYRKFLATAVPTDNRYHTAEERMADLEKEAP